VRKYETTAAFESALRDRLRALETPDRTFQDLRKQLAFGRVIARLQLAAPDSWLLKGGVALEYRLKWARATLDIDVSTQLDLDEIGEVLSRSAVLELDDYFQISIGEREQPADEVATYRFHIDVQYASGKLFESLALDVGLAEPWLADPIDVLAPSLLEVFGVPATRVRTIPSEQHLAEKIHAYTRMYGDRRSTRVKDLVDMVLILHAGVDSERLELAIAEIFRHRATHEPPTALLPPPADWSISYAALARSLPVPPDLDEAFGYVYERLSAVLSIFNDPKPP
jgi:Nucleotidyl transferase AbiEii toxin, Type IV TA system